MSGREIEPTHAKPHAARNPVSLRMFGTDGVRGTPGQPPLDERTITRLGGALVRVLDDRDTTLLVARDTRESGPWIETSLARGVASEEGRLVSVGVMPTPAAALLASSQGFDAAFVISASHNPYPDNGIKVLTGEGEKASPELEARIEEVVADQSWTVKASARPSVDGRDLTDVYLTHARTVLAGVEPLPPLRVAVDCANGATSVVAPQMLQEVGFDVITLNVEPDGRNINENCGSTHPEALQQAVKGEGCQLGLAFDGDGDRVILVDHHGEVVDGDAVLFICARYLSQRGRLPGNAVVSTVMSNIGLELALRDAGVAMHRCPVGDRQVREAMVEHGITLGGEQSGHIIFSDLLPTGDGLLTALSVIRVMSESGRSLADLKRALKVYPQVLLNVTVRAKPDLSTEPEIASAIQEAERTLAGQGRVLVRYSGTEPLLRIMIEGTEAATIQRLAEAIATHATRRLG